MITWWSSLHPAGLVAVADIFIAPLLLPVCCCFLDELTPIQVDRFFLGVDKFIDELVMSGWVGVHGHSFGNKPDLLSIYCLRFFKQFVLPIGVETKDEPRSVYCFLRFGLAGVISSIEVCCCLPPVLFSSLMAETV